MIEGEIEVRSGEARQVLGPGDTARYAADVAHRIGAPKGAARAFLVVRDA